MKVVVHPVSIRYIFVFAGLIVGVAFLVLYRPLLSFYHQQQAGSVLRAVIPAGENAYGGFACLHPFIDDLEIRKNLLVAVDHLQQAKKLSANPSHVYYLLGKTYCLLGDYKNAVLALQHFTELRPRNPLGLLEMGFALLELCPPNGKCSDGLNTHDVWLKAGLRAEHLVAQAEQYRLSGSYQQAYQWYQHAKRMGVELSSTISYMKYLDLNSLQDEQQALNFLRVAVQMDRGWVSEKMRIEAMFNYAHAMLLSEKFAEAEKYYLKVLKKTKDLEEYNSLNDTIYFHLGSLYAWTGKSARAEPLLQYSIKVNPDNFWAYINLGISAYWANPQQIELVMSYFDQALQVSGNSQSAWSAVVQFWLNRNLTMQQEYYCRRAFEKGIELSNCDPVNE